ncbi:hypothetical protein M5K25_010554 [Dendrobium thyrsiflorum]|uniref:Uncharacterized protein n=1 Tax=Dendrobium thyrsiflorum TaxID=117978 RepID=A0ABD0V0S3_DENTH
MINFKLMRKPGVTRTTRQVYTSLASSCAPAPPSLPRHSRRLRLLHRYKGTNLFSTFVSSRSTAYTRISLRGGKGARCDTYDEASRYLPDQYKLVLDVRVEPEGTRCDTYDEAVRTWHVSSSRWFRRPNGTTPMVLPPNGTVGKRLRPGPSEPGGLPPNGTIILRSWSSPQASRIVAAGFKDSSSSATTSRLKNSNEGCLEQ